MNWYTLIYTQPSLRIGVDGNDGCVYLRFTFGEAGMMTQPAISCSALIPTPTNGPSPRFAAISPQQETAILPASLTTACTFSEDMKSTRINSRRTSISWIWKRWSGLGSVPKYQNFVLLLSGWRSIAYIVLLFPRGSRQVIGISIPRRPLAITCTSLVVGVIYPVRTTLG